MILKENEITFPCFFIEKTTITVAILAQVNWIHLWKHKYRRVQHTNKHQLVWLLKVRLRCVPRGTWLWASGKITLSRVRRKQMLLLLLLLVQRLGVVAPKADAAAAAAEGDVFCGPQVSDDTERTTLWLDDAVMALTAVLDVEFAADPESTVFCGVDSYILPKQVPRSVALRVGSIFYSIALQFCWSTDMTVLKAISAVLIFSGAWKPCWVFVWPRGNIIIWEWGHLKQLKVSDLTCRNQTGLKYTWWSRPWWIGCLCNCNGQRGNSLECPIRPHAMNLLPPLDEAARAFEVKSHAFHHCLAVRKCGGGGAAWELGPLRYDFCAAPLTRWLFNKHHGGQKALQALQRKIWPGVPLHMWLSRRSSHELKRNTKNMCLQGSGTISATPYIECKTLARHDMGCARYDIVVQNCTVIPFHDGQNNFASFIFQIHL